MAVDIDTAAALDLIATDWTHQAAKEEVERIILAVAFDHEGAVNPNEVRRRLPSWVTPQIVGPTYRRMCLEGVLEPAGWTTSDDVRGRNSGKPARMYRLKGEA